MTEQELQELQKALGYVIRRHRETQGFSQEAFAYKIGIHRTYFSAIERGERNPSLRSLVRIAIALSVSLSSLFEEAEAKIASLGQKSASEPK